MLQGVEPARPYREMVERLPRAGNELEVSTQPMYLPVTIIAELRGW